MKLVRADLITSPCSTTCARCEEKIPAGTEHWREVWSDEGVPTEVEDYHVKCDNEDETQEELRNQVIEHLAGDHG